MLLFFFSISFPLLLRFAWIQFFSASDICVCYEYWRWKRMDIIFYLFVLLLLSLWAHFKYFVDATTLGRLNVLSLEARKRGFVHSSVLNPFVHTAFFLRAFMDSFDGLSSVCCEICRIFSIRIIKIGVGDYRSFVLNCSFSIFNISSKPQRPRQIVYKLKLLIVSALCRTQ